MKEIKIRIRGMGEGILMHSPKGMLNQKLATKNPAKNYDPKVDAENVTYRTQKGELMIPVRCMKKCFLNASSFFKIGKHSAKQVLSGYTSIEPFEIILRDKKGKPLKNYEIDLRPVNVQRAKIIRARPLIRNWEADFIMIYDENIISKEALEMLKEIFVDSGKRIGILDNRPQTLGDNGKFELIYWKPQK